MKKLLIVLIFITSFSFGQKRGSEICSELKSQMNSNMLNLAKVQYPGDENIDAKYYKIDISVDHINKQINSIVEVKFEVLSDELNTFFLDLSSVLTVSSVEYSDGNSSGVVSFNHNSDKLNITAHRQLTKGEQYSVLISYSGRPITSGFASFTFGTTPNGNASIYTLSQPYGTSDWWPCKDTPADKADSSDVWITVDKSLIPVSNGKLVEIVDNGLTNTYKWKNHYPIAQYLISMAISNFTVYEHNFVVNDSTTLDVIHYNYPENYNANRISELNRTIPMLQVFSDLFGEYPYPNEKYGHAEFGWGGGMEHQTISSMGAYNQDIVAHELAHQWFGDKVTCKNWQNIWLNEGFATYSESLYREFSSGYLDYMSSVRFDMGRAKVATGSIYVNNINTISSIFDPNRTYSKGAVVLHMLRNVIGDQLFFESLKAYSDDPDLAYNVAATEDFQRIVESVSGQDLDYFFSQWIYGENYPKYSAAWSSIKNGESFNVEVDLQQSTNSDPRHFIMPVDFKFSFDNSDTTVTVFNNLGNQKFNFTFQSDPSNLEIDPEFKILRDIQQVTKVDEDNDLQPNQIKLFQNFPNPFNPSTAIKFSLPKESNVELAIYDLLGNKILTLINSKYGIGTHTINFNPADYNKQLSSAVYIYTLTSGETEISKKMLLVK
ncbi:MAG: T9SS type A sorting domain-containing protein [Melioribacteraceae bacterium]|nr:T9SS type A sorting domain-containing protein [Melioribacteraceae bacterium]